MTDLQDLDVPQGFEHLFPHRESRHRAKRSSILKQLDNGGNTDVMSDDRRSSKRVSFAREFLPDGTTQLVEKQLKSEQLCIENAENNGSSLINQDPVNQLNVSNKQRRGSDLINLLRQRKSSVGETSKSELVGAKPRRSRAKTAAAFKNHLQRNYDINDEKDYDTLFNTSVNRYGREIVPRTEKPDVTLLFREVDAEMDLTKFDDFTDIASKEVVKTISPTKSTMSMDNSNESPVEVTKFFDCQSMDMSLTGPQPSMDMSNDSVNLSDCSSDGDFSAHDTTFMTDAADDTDEVIGGVDIATDEVTDAVNIAIDEVIDAVDIATNEGNDAVDIATDEVIDVVDIATNEGNDAVDIATDEVIGGVDIATDEVTDAVNIAIDEVIDAVDIATNEGNDAVDIATDEINDAVDIATNEVNNAVDVATDEVMDAVDIDTNEVTDAVDIETEKEINEVVEELVNQVIKASTKRMQTSCKINLLSQIKIPTFRQSGAGRSNFVGLSHPIPKAMPMSSKLRSLNILRRKPYFKLGERKSTHQSQIPTVLKKFDVSPLSSDNMEKSYDFNRTDTERNLVENDTSSTSKILLSSLLSQRPAAHLPSSPARARKIVASLKRTCGFNIQEKLLKKVKEAEEKYDSNPITTHDALSQAAVPQSVLSPVRMDEEQPKSGCNTISKEKRKSEITNYEDVESCSPPKVEKLDLESTAMTSCSEVLDSSCVQASHVIDCSSSSTNDSDITTIDEDEESSSSSLDSSWYSIQASFLQYDDSLYLMAEQLEQTLDEVTCAHVLEEENADKTVADFCFVLYEIGSDFLKQNNIKIEQYTENCITFSFLNGLVYLCVQTGSDNDSRCMTAVDGGMRTDEIFSSQNAVFFDKERSFLLRKEHSRVLQPVLCHLNHFFTRLQNSFKEKYPKVENLEELLVEVTQACTKAKMMLKELLFITTFHNCCIEKRSDTTFDFIIEILGVRRNMFLVLPIDSTSYSTEEIIPRFGFHPSDRQRYSIRLFRKALQKIVPSEKYLIELLRASKLFVKAMKSVEGNRKRPKQLIAS